jgi:hypothetical protein
LNTKTTPKVLDIIRTAAADCQARRNTAAANELLDAASMTSDLLEALKASIGPLELYHAYGWPDRAGVIHNIKAAISKASLQMDRPQESN